MENNTWSMSIILILLMFYGIVSVLSSCSHDVVHTTKHRFNPDSTNHINHDSLGGKRCNAIIPRDGKPTVLVYRKPCYIL